MSAEIRSSAIFVYSTRPLEARSSAILVYKMRHLFTYQRLKLGLFTPSDCLGQGFPPLVYILRHFRSRGI